MRRLIDPFLAQKLFGLPKERLKTSTKYTHKCILPICNNTVESNQLACSREHFLEYRKLQRGE